MKNFLFATVLIIFFCLLEIGCSVKSYDEAGWKFLCKRLKSPSSAKLVSYVDKENMKDVLKKADIQLDPCITAEMYDYDAQNSFGAIIRDSYVVFFKNGKPCHLEKSNSIKKGNSQLLKIALEMNDCGCN